MNGFPGPEKPSGLSRNGPLSLWSVLTNFCFDSRLLSWASVVHYCDVTKLLGEENLELDSII